MGGGGEGRGLGARGRVGYMNVVTPDAAKCFLMSLSVPYQLKCGVECPILGRCTDAVSDEQVDTHTQQE